MNPPNPATQTNQQPNPPTAAPPAPAKHYYYKELFSNAWYIGGKPVQFEQLDGNRGVLALDAGDPLIAGLDQAAREQVGGIVRISAEEYAKKKSLFPLRERKQETLQVAPRADQIKKPSGKAFRPPAPQESPESAALAEQNPAGPPAAAIPGGDSPAPAGAPNEPPQRPPDQPDFKTSEGTPRFTPKTARAGTGKAQEPSAV